MPMKPELLAIAPDRIKRLRVDESRGFPVPWFVAWIDGRPEFRTVEAGKIAKAWREKLCWVCGEVLGRRVVYTIGPMCVLNRISGEPPAHPDCAEFSARACPFLSRPNMERREAGLPDDTRTAPGSLPHNPGGTVLYMPMDHTRIPNPAGGGYLFKLGEALRVEWWTLGRLATPAEAAELLAVGAVRLRELAAGEGPAALKEFDRLHARALGLLPTAA